MKPKLTSRVRRGALLWMESNEDRETATRRVQSGGAKALADFDAFCDWLAAWKRYAAYGPTETATETAVAPEAAAA